MRMVLMAATVFFLLTVQAFAEVSVPKAAQGVAGQLDAQLAERLQLLEGPADGTSLILTTPVDLSDLEKSSPLARLMAEELAAWFVQSGYRVREVRKTRNILLAPGSGELSLSRDLRFVDSRHIQSAVLLTGTYTQTSKHVRFNIRLIHAASSEVLAMASSTIQITPETAELLDPESRRRAASVRPSVMTSFPTTSMVTQPISSRWALPKPKPRARPMRKERTGPEILDLTE